MSTPAISVRQISKTFDGQRALNNVDIDFPAGKITALLGENGSGKSTLIKIIAGFYTPDPESGSIKVYAQPVRLPVDSHEIRKMGVRFLHQDLAIIPEMTILDNFGIANGFLGQGQLFPVFRAQERKRVDKFLRMFGVAVDPETPLCELSSAQQTMVAIIRAFAGTGQGQQGMPILVLDEPTAALHETEVETVFRALRTAVHGGASVIYVSHRIDEVREIASHLVVLRDGRVVENRSMEELSTDQIVELIVGRLLQPHAPSIGATSHGEILLRVRGLTGPRLRNVDLDLYRGEVLGITGLRGCGRSELARIIAGAQAPQSGLLELEGVPMEPKSPRNAQQRGIGYVPQNRRSEGVIQAMLLRENVTLPVLPTFFSKCLLNKGKERAFSRHLIRQLNVQPPQPERTMNKLSGGNQQKAVFARNVGLSLRVLVLDEPSQGIDVRARREVADIIQRLAAEGIGVIVASSDYAEIAQVCERVIVLDRGVPVAELAGYGLTEEELTATCLAARSDTLTTLEANPDV